MLESGRIVADGTPETLLAKSDAYRRLIQAKMAETAS
jgi:ABC-type multidrug transport system fused ATPase/permease subunit